MSRQIICAARGYCGRLEDKRLREIHEKAMFSEPIITAGIRNIVYQLPDAALMEMGDCLISPKEFERESADRSISESEMATNLVRYKIAVPDQQSLEETLKAFIEAPGQNECMAITTLVADPDRADSECAQLTFMSKTGQAYSVVFGTVENFQAAYEHGGFVVPSHFSMSREVFLDYQERNQIYDFQVSHEVDAYGTDIVEATVYDMMNDKAVLEMFVSKSVEDGLIVEYDLTFGHDNFTTQISGYIDRADSLTEESFDHILVVDEKEKDEISDHSLV